VSWGDAKVPERRTAQDARRSPPVRTRCGPVDQRSGYWREYLHGVCRHGSVDDVVSSAVSQLSHPLIARLASLRAVVGAARRGCDLSPSGRVVEDLRRPGELVRDEYGDCDPPRWYVPGSLRRRRGTGQRTGSGACHDDPPQVRQTARQLLADGVAHHEIIHELEQVTS
jgi:hypothetical protein